MLNVLKRFQKQFFDFWKFVSLIKFSFYLSGTWYFLTETFDGIFFIPFSMKLWSANVSEDSKKAKKKTEKTSTSYWQNLVFGEVFFSLGMCWNVEFFFIKIWGRIFISCSIFVEPFGFFPTKDMQTPPSQFWCGFYGWCGICWIEWKAK